MSTSPSPSGLSTAEVRVRILAGQVNTQSKTTGKSVPRILFDNVFTFFNFLNLALGALVIWAGSYKNALFLGVIFCNTLIGIVQELRAKRTLDSLSLLSEAAVTVFRDGHPLTIPMSELVQDDTMQLRAGRQVCADATLVDGTLEVNESLLTGESETIIKQPGDALLSGSYVISGEALAIATQVGPQSYANRLTAEAKTARKHPSTLRDAINRILHVVSAIILPLGIGYSLSQFFATQSPPKQIIVGTVAAMLGMIPEGLFLLTSVALAVGVVNLGKRHTLVRELFCLETLARVDVMCLDKTGTLTEGHMRVDAVIPLSPAPFDDIIPNLMHALPDTNETATALRAHFQTANSLPASDILPFSSARKFSGAVLAGDAYWLGAYEFILAPGHQDQAILAQITHHANLGARVLLLAKGDPSALQNPLTAIPIPLALILISDVIRESAAETLRFFRAQDTRLMILSGDHPQTVASIADRLGFVGADAAIDASTLHTDADMRTAVEKYRIFGRVKPEQKKQILLALKHSGHTVAMVGDGVNDVPALKQADCSIAMASGSDAAKQSANLVLLDSNFAALPHVVNEGRRVINNIQSAASLFLVKTIFSAILTLLMLLLATPYPFIPLHLTLISSCAVGIPTFLFALAPNHDRVQPNFFASVWRIALSGALCISLFVLAASLFARLTNAPDAVRSTLCVLSTGAASLALIPRVYPLRTPWRRLVFSAMLSLFVMSSLLFADLLQLVPLPPNAALLAALLIALAYPLPALFLRLFPKPPR